MYYFCTYFDQNYLDKGLALYHSLTKHCMPFRLWILCMDAMTYRILSEMQMPQIQLISLPDFERDDPSILLAKQNRSVIEYYFTCTPSLPLYILNQVPEVDIITYLDADLSFFSSVEPVFQEFGNGSVLIIGHRFPSALKKKEIQGIYNIGLLSFRRDNNGFACISWWRDRCLEWCYDQTENGHYADQKYLDDWPNRFAGVVVLQHKGAGLAPWNLGNYKFSRNHDEIRVDGQPIIFYHFHGIRRINRWIYDTNIIGYLTRLPNILKQGLYIPYLKELSQIHQDLEKYGWNCSSERQESRVSDKSKRTLQLEILAILYPVIFYLKWINNELIFLNE